MQQGDIHTTGVHEVPDKYTNSVTQVAYLVPDLEGTITITLYNASNPSQNIGCFHSGISNGKSTEQQSVKYATLGLAAAALVISAVSSANGSAGAGGGAGGGGGGGAGTGAAPVGHLTVTGAEGTSGAGGAGGGGAAAASGPGTNVAAGGFHPPGFSEFFSVMQGIAISGMYSLNYPSAYRSFTQNVGWSTGIITWAGMQTSIDKFRNQTGGNLTMSSYERLQKTTLVYRDNDNANTTDISSSISSANSTAQAKFKRLVDIYSRQVNFANGNSSSSSNSTNTSGDAAAAGDDDSNKYVELVTGIRAYVEKLSVPSTNTFMTLLIWFAIIVGICIAGILAVKLILEVWSLKGNRKNKFEGFRKRYHLFLASTLVRLVIIFYGLWVLYCFYQFKIGDSWGALLLAGLVFGITTIVLIGFTIRIIWIAHVASKQKGGLEYLFKHKPWIRKYGLFYDQFKIKYWWCFIPSLMASFGRNAFIALGYGNGMVQIIGQLVIDLLLTMLFIACMPFNTKMGNGINIAIQVVRVISLALLLTFAVQFNLNQITATGIGLALIVIQAIMSVLLIVLICINATVGIFRMTCGGRKKKKAKKEEEKRRLEEEEASSAGSDFTGQERPSYDEKDIRNAPAARNSFNFNDNKPPLETSRESIPLTSLDPMPRVLNPSPIPASGEPRPGSVNTKSIRSSIAVTENMPVGNSAKRSFEYPTSNRASLVADDTEVPHNVEIPRATDAGQDMVVPNGLRRVETPSSPQGTPNFSRQLQPIVIDQQLNSKPSKRHLLGHEASNSTSDSSGQDSFHSLEGSGFNMQTSHHQFI